MPIVVSDAIAIITAALHWVEDETQENYDDFQIEVARVLDPRARRLTGFRALLNVSTLAATSLITNAGHVKVTPAAYLQDLALELEKASAEAEIEKARAEAEVEAEYMTEEEIAESIKPVIESLKRVGQALDREYGPDIPAKQDRTAAASMQFDGVKVTASLRGTRLTVAVDAPGSVQIDNSEPGQPRAEFHLDP